MEGLNLLLGILVVSCAGCNSLPAGPVPSVTTRPAPALPRSGEAYLLRGWRGLWSEGIDRLGEELRAAGVDAQVFRADQADELAEALARRFAGDGPSGSTGLRPARGDTPRLGVARQTASDRPLVLIGFSYGADDAIRVAKRLGQAGIAVDLLVTIDPVTPPPVPGNVRACRNYYQSNGPLDIFPWLRGIPLRSVEKPAPTSRPVNVDIRRRPDLLEVRTSHATIAANPKLHRAILDDVLSLCPAR